MDESHDFGEVAAGTTASAVFEVEVRNVGGTALHVERVWVTDPDGFRVSVSGSPVVPKGQTATIVVEFAPQASGSFSSALVIETNDATQPVAGLSLTGVGGGPGLEVSPLAHDFGELSVGCSASVPVVLGNSGTSLLTIQDVAYTTASSDLALDSGEGALPWSLQPGEELELWVDYVPLVAEPAVGHLQVWSDDVGRPLATSSQHGRGTVQADVVDVFEQPIVERSDILFVVDHSGFQTEYGWLEDSFPIFTAVLDERKVDYRIGVVTEDDGCINHPGSEPPFVHPGMTPFERETVFSTMLCEEYSGTYCISFGGNTERGFMLLEAALSAENISEGGCNEGLYREDAALVLIGMSDEPEQSVQQYEYYVDRFQAMKADPSEVVIHAIGGDYPRGCDSHQAFTGFYQATVATGGLFLSACVDDFDDHMRALAGASGQRRTEFPLSAEPVVETLRVKVNSLELSGSWEYDVDDGVVVFDDEAVPEGGATVEVSYAEQPDCGG